MRCRRPTVHDFALKLICCLCAVLITASPARAYESDQYMNRTQPVADSLAVMDQQVNEAIDVILARQRPPETRLALARAIYHEIGGLYWADKIERWAARSPEVEKYDQTRHRSIYRSMPLWATRVNFLFGVGRSFRVNNVMVGSDKFGHFVSQGYKYFKREQKGRSRQWILGWGAFAERWIYGQFTTGVYSNADLVANYEGWRFYRSLFLDEEIPGKPAIVRKVDGRYVRQREFTWADHITPYWDEALNPSYNVRSLDWRLRREISRLCPQYRQYPRFYSSPRDDELWLRYHAIGLKDNRDNRFEVVCGTPD